MSLTIRTRLTPEQIERAIEKGLVELGVKIVAEAKLRAPYKQGTLRNTIMWKTAKSSGGLDGGDALSTAAGKNDLLVGSNLEYAIYQEFGTRYMAPRPYLRPAIAIATGRAAADVERAVTEEIAKGKLYEGRKFTRFF